MITKILNCSDEILTLWWNYEILRYGCYWRFWYMQRKCGDILSFCHKINYLTSDLDETTEKAGYYLAKKSRRRVSDKSFLSFLLLLNRGEGTCWLCVISLMSVFSVHLVINQQLQQLGLPGARSWAAPSQDRRYSTTCKAVRPSTTGTNRRP